MKLFRSLLISLGAICWASAAAACPVCIDLPTKTLADHVLGDRITVLATAEAGNPFKFKIAEVLRGDPGEVQTLPPIPFLISSATRRSMEQRPGTAVLLTYGPSRAEASAANLFGQRDLSDAWHKFLIVTEDRRRFLDGIIAKGEAWEWGRTVDPARVSYFGSFLAHPDKGIQDLALAEISRAPYAAIRTLASAVSPVELRERLTSISDIPYAPVSVLLLGASAVPQMQDYVRDRFEASLSNGGYLLSAWAVAGIEVDRHQAVARIASRLRQRALPAEDRQNLVLALSFAGTALEDLRPEISPVLRAEVRAHPENVAEIANAFYDWKDWSLSGEFRDMLSQPDIDPATRFILSNMVASARNAGVVGAGE